MSDCLDCAGDGYRAACVSLDEMAQNSLPGMRRILGILLREISQPHTFLKRVSEHTCGG